VIVPSRPAQKHYAVEHETLGGLDLARLHVCVSVLSETSLAEHTLLAHLTHMPASYTKYTTHLWSFTAL